MRIVLTGSMRGSGGALAERLLSHAPTCLGVARSDQTEFASAATGWLFFATRCDVADWTQVAARPHNPRRMGRRWRFATPVLGQARARSGPPPRSTRCNGVPRCGPISMERFTAIRAFHAALSSVSPPAPGKNRLLLGRRRNQATPNFSATGPPRPLSCVSSKPWRKRSVTTPLDINAVAPGAINTRLTDELIALGPGVVGESEYQAAIGRKSPAAPRWPGHWIWSSGCCRQASDGNQRR